MDIEKWLINLDHLGETFSRRLDENIANPDNKLDDLGGVWTNLVALTNSVEGFVPDVEQTADLYDLGVDDALTALGAAGNVIERCTRQLSDVANTIGEQELLAAMRARASMFSVDIR